MDITEYTVKELNEKLDNNIITPYEIYEAYINNILEKDKFLGSFLSLNKYINDEEDDEIKNKKIEEYNLKYRIPIGIKDNIAVEDLPLTCSSKMLEKYISPYDASVIKLLKENGMYIIGKNNLDEFAAGIGTQNSELLRTVNPLDKTRIPGGSSGGSAAAVAANLIPCSLGTDTGGSIRQPASYCGVVGFKPSYGLVSRYGVVSSISSFDQVGTITKTVEDASILMNIITEKDEETEDPNTIVLNKNYLENVNNDIKGKRIGVVRELIEDFSEEVKVRFNKAIEIFKNLNTIIDDVKIPYLYESTLIYEILGYAEMSSNLEKYDGISYGLKIDSDDYESSLINTRTEGFGKEIKRRIILGTNTLQKENYKKYYLKAAKIRRKIVEELNKIFKNYDAIIMPTTPDIAPKINELENVDISKIDKCVMIANIAGLPSISIPIDKTEDLPIGLQIISKQFNDDLVLNIANIYEKYIGSNI